MSDVHALVGAYAVDAVDDVERAAFERHLAVCADCRLELASLRETAARLPDVEPVEPPAGLRDSVLAGITSVRPLPPEVHTEPARPDSRRRFRPRTLLAAAAAVLVLGGGGAVVWQQVADDTPTQAPPTATPLERVRDADDAEEFTQTHDGIEVTLVRSRSLNEAVLVAEDLPPLPAGKVYELWLDHKGVGMVPAGLMQGGSQEVQLEGDPGTARGAGITVEPAGGSEKPTSDPMMTFAFEKV